MIDTIFFLLVYFMIASLTMVQMSAYRVALPQSTTAEGKPTEKIVVSLAKDGRYYVNREQVAFDQIPGLLKDAVRDNPFVTVIINVDKNQNVKQFLGVMSVSEAANPGDLVIATEHTDSK